MKYSVLSVFISLIVLPAGEKLFAQLVLHFDVNNTTCQVKHGHNLDGNNIGTGRISVVASGGTAPYTYGISGSHTYTRTQNNGYFPQLYLGDYTITVKDAGGLRKDTVIHISSDLPIPAFAKPATQNPSICESADGKITFPTPTSGRSPFLYSIDGGASFGTDNVFKNLRAGYYMCNITDANGCLSFYWPINLFNTVTCSIGAGQSNTKTACAADAEPVYMNFYNYKDSAMAYSFDSVHYTTLKGGNFSCSGGQCYRLDSFANLTPGIHNLYLWDSVLKVRNTAIINVGFSCEIYIRFISTDASCGESDGALTVNASSGVPPYTYSMDGIHFQTSNVFAGLATGNYTVTVKDATGALSSDVGSVYNKCPLVFYTKYNDSCGTNGGKIVASGSMGTKPYLFSLDKVNYQSGNIFDHLVPGTYKLYLKDAKGYMDSTGNIRIIPACIVNTISITNEFCNSSNATVSIKTSGGTKPYSGGIFNLSSSGYSVTFSYDSTYTIYHQSAGKYRFSIYDWNGVNYVDTIEILNTMPLLNLGNDTTLCAGKTLTLNPNISGATYNWQDSSKNNTFPITKAGTYWVRAKIATCVVSDTIHISYMNNLTDRIFPTKDTTLCIGNSILLDALNPGAAYLWNNNATDRTQTETTSGKYWVTASLSGCSISDTINLHFINGPTISLPKDTLFCSGTSVQLNAGLNTATYLWNTNATGNSISVFQAGKYWVAATAYGCTNIDTINVKQFPLSSVFLGNDSVLCTGQTLVLNAGNGFTNYTWSTGSAAASINVTTAGKYAVTVTDTNNCKVADTINISYTQTPVFSFGNDTILCEKQTLLLQSNAVGNYVWQDGSVQKQKTINSAGLYWLEINNIGCIYRDSILVKYNPLPVIHLPADTILCDQQTLVLDALQTGGGAIYSWQDGSTASNYFVKNAGIYRVQVTRLGCSNYDTCTVEYQQTPQGKISTDTTKCKNETIVLNASFPNAAYLWQDFSSLPTFTASAQGKYYCTINNYCGSVTDTFNVVDKICDCTVIMPNAFSPNGDGINDLLKPNIDCTPSYYSLTIFDRNGHPIFNSNNIADYWDGTYQHKPVPIGTYYYIIKVKGVSDPILREKSGGITIIR